MRERAVVQDAAAATALSRPRIQVLIAALIDEDCTLARLAARTGMSYSLLSHHMGRLQKLGLVRVAGSAPRAGRASPLYRATARSYFIPAVWCKTLPGEQLAHQLRQALQVARSPKGLLLGSDGGPRMQLLFEGPDTDTGTTELWMRLRLSPPAARKFNEELRALFERWREQSGSKGRDYLVHGAAVPVKPG